MKFYSKASVWKWHFALYPAWCDKCGCGIWLEDCRRKYVGLTGREGVSTYDVICKKCWDPAEEGESKVKFRKVYPRKEATKKQNASLDMDYIEAMRELDAEFPTVEAPK